jgi:hypothetical protein
MILFSTSDTPGAAQATNLSVEASLMQAMELSINVSQLADSQICLHRGHAIRNAVAIQLARLFSTVGR